MIFKKNKLPRQAAIVPLLVNTKTPTIAQFTLQLVVHLF